MEDRTYICSKDSFVKLFDEVSSSVSSRSPPTRSHSDLKYQHIGRSPRWPPLLFTAFFFFYDTKEKVTEQGCVPVVQPAGVNRYCNGIARIYTDYGFKHKYYVRKIMLRDRTFRNVKLCDAAVHCQIQGRLCILRDVGNSCQHFTVFNL